MTLEQVTALCRRFSDRGLDFWLDGGWGVDALLHKQTRSHSDLDLAVQLSDLTAFESVLHVEGYLRADRLNDPNWNLVMKKVGGQTVDLHGFVFDEVGNAVLGDPADKNAYPAGALDGVGNLQGLAVRCVDALHVLRFRNSFEPRAADRHDVAVLCAHFGLPLPSRFR